MTTDTVGDVWQFTMELCRALARSGDRICLASMGAMANPRQRQEAGAIPGLDLHASRFRLEWMDAPWSDVEAAGEWLLDLAERFDPTVVHLNQYSFGALRWTTPVVMTGHACVLSWWRAVHGRDAPAEWRDYQRHVQDGLRAADLVVAPTRAMLDALDLHYGPLPPSRVIASGCDLASTPPAKDASMVLSSGPVWDEGKNMAALAAVAPSLPWPVCIAGDGGHPDGGTTHLPNVRLLGRLDAGEMGSWYARAPIYALPARYEPFGLPVLEAALAGCALVLGDLPGLREVWGDAALYVHPDDHAGLQAQLQQLIDDADLRERLSARAHVRARRYSADAMARAYRRAYADVELARAPPRQPGRVPVLRPAFGDPQ
jgi:glycosyltransferase involved in cell wall biosynthesis